MTLLALEFSSDRRSAAVARDDLCLAEAVQHTDSRATDAFGLVTRALADAGVSRREIEVIAVGLGPGSYTGIRAAIAMAQGWQLAAGIRLLGVSSAETIARRAQAENIFGLVHVMIDAQRGEFYVAVWDVSTDGCREISPLKIVSGGEAASLKQAGKILAEPEVDRVLLPRAVDIARLASHRTNFVSGEQLEPIYLRQTTFVKAAPGRTA